MVAATRNSPTSMLFDFEVADNNSLFGIFPNSTSIDKIFDKKPRFCVK